MATMRDVALKAGVSYTTVSYVLNNRPAPRGIRDSVRIRVIRAAAELDYQPNSLARAVVTGNSRVLGFLAFDQESPKSTEFIARIQSGMSEHAGFLGYSVKVFHAGDGQPLSDIVEQCLAWRSVGLVTVSLWHGTLSGLVNALGTHSIPLAAVEAGPEVHVDINVRTDDAKGMQLAFQHLASLGHRRIGYLSADPSQELSNRRLEVLRAARIMAGFDDSDDLAAWGDWWDIEKNTAAVCQLLDRPPGRRPTALICSGDPPALVALKVARRLGLSVPGDLSVVGFGDYSMATYADPALTTIAVPFEEMGRSAARKLIALAEDRGDSTASAVVHADEAFEPSLVVRDSTSRPPGATAEG
ncbi:MAG: LacI family DNA-binding transcriptional regulator [Capsulimonadaceae bacterium]|nr:LacI family DNA-binding transcriptional regulator [Capsulimonadaceae bacterium]